MVRRVKILVTGLLTLVAAAWLVHYAVAAPPPSPASARPERAGVQPPVGRPLPPAPARIDWTMFRGGPALTGAVAAGVRPPLRLKWRFETGEGIDSSASIVAGRVTIGSDDGHVYCLDAANGNLVWKFRTGAAVKSSPCVAGSRVYVGSLDESIYALAASDGRKLWSRKTEGEVHASPILAGGRLLVGSYDGFLYCLAPDTGEVRWRAETGNYVHASSGFDGRHTVVTGCDGQVRILNLEDGSELGAYDTQGPIPPSAALHRGVAYVGNHEGRFFAIACDRAEVLWQFSTPKDPQPFLASPAVTDRFVVFGGQDQQVRCHERVTGRPRWIFPTEGAIDSSPAIAGDLVYVGSDDGVLYALSLADGRKRWSYRIGQAIRSSPAVANGLVVVGCQDGAVYAFEETHGARGATRGAQRRNP